MVTRPPTVADWLTDRRVYRVTHADGTITHEVDRAAVRRVTRAWALANHSTFIQWNGGPEGNDRPRRRMRLDK